MRAPDALRLALRRRYAIRRELGRGGTSIVYLADDLKHDRPVAVKVLRPEIAVTLGPDRFLREIQLAAKLQHPHILPLHDSGESEGWLYYVMPCVEGPTLRRRLDQEGQLAVDEALSITVQVCAALAHAHEHGIVHRDVKPENVLLSGEHALVADFGIAQALASAGAERLTDTGIAVGTPTYMSPEQAGGAAPVDGRADVYAVGCVLYEMLAGSPPFTGPTTQAVLARHALDPVPPLRTVRRSVPAHVERAVMRALEKSPADRFQSVEELADALAAEPPMDRHAPKLRRARVLAAVVVVMLAATWVAVDGRGADASPMQRIAVLPPDDLGGGASQTYFVDGIHDALIAELAQIDALSVISRPTMVRYGGTDKVIPEIAAELGVDAVVSSSLLVVGDSVRVTVTLIDGHTDQPLWAETYERDLRDLLRLYGELATAIAEAVHVALTPDERSRLASAPEVDPEVHDLALRGQHECWQWSEAGFRQGIRYLEAATARDSAYANAHAWLAYCYADQVFFGHGSPGEGYPRARRAVERAITLDPTLADAYAARAIIRHEADFDFDGPEEDFRKALELSPGNAQILILYSSYLTFGGRFADALELNERALALDPLSEATSLNLGWTYFKARRYDQAVAQLERTLELAPGYFFAHLELGWTYSAKEMHEEAVAECDAAFAHSPQDDDPLMLGTCGWVHGRAGRADRAEEMLVRLRDLSARRWVDPSPLAMVHIGLGDLESALELLSRAVHAREPSLVGLKVDPFWDPLREHPRFRAFLDELGIEPL